jgi:hypothetical protein
MIKSYYIKRKYYNNQPAYQSSFEVNIIEYLHSQYTLYD